MKDENTYCHVCKKLVWESSKEIDGFVEGYVSIEPDAKLKVESDIEEWYWDFEEFNIKISDGGLWFCSEDCLLKWLKSELKKKHLN